MSSESALLLPDGVFLNLPEDIYFAQPRLGSTDMSRLYLNEEGWWWKSALNPDRVDSEDNSAKEFGKGLHALVLEGDDAFAERVAIYPDKNELSKLHGELFCVTLKDILTQLEKRGFNPKANAGKPFLISYASSRAPELIMWDTLDAEWERVNKGKIKVTAAEDRQLRIMTEAVRNHPQVGPLFQYGAEHVPLSEVTIFWHDEQGNARRGRLDQMLPQTTCDVKTLQNVAGRPLKYAAGEHMAKLGYHVQMADHHIARKYAYRFISEGKVFDGAEVAPAEDRTFEEHARSTDKFRRELAWIKRFPTEAPNWDYAWLFYQKPDAKAGMAPIIFPWAEDYWDGESHGTAELHMRGLRGWIKAMQTYKRCMLQFGPDKPWTRVEPVHTSVEGAKNRVYYPPWTGGDEAIPGEEEYL